MCAVFRFWGVNLSDLMFLQKSTDVYWSEQYTYEHRTNTSPMCCMWHQLHVSSIKNKRHDFSALFRNHLTERGKKQSHNLTVLLPSEWYITQKLLHALQPINYIYTLQLGGRNLVHPVISRDLPLNPRWSEATPDLLESNTSFILTTTASRRWRTKQTT